MAIRDARAHRQLAPRAMTSGLDDVRGEDLRDLTVGVVGVGRIGEAVIGAAAGIRLPGAGPRPRPATRPPSSCPLEDLLRESDVVTLHLPLDRRHPPPHRTPSIEMMKPGAFLINTGRGALRRHRGAARGALESGTARRRGAGCARRRGRALLLRSAPASRSTTRCCCGCNSCPNVIITPHTAYYTERASVRHRRADPHQLPELRKEPGDMEQAEESRSCSGAARRSMTCR